MKWIALLFVIVLGIVGWWAHTTFSEPLACTDPNGTTQSRCDLTTPRAVPTTTRTSTARTTTSAVPTSTSSAPRPVPSTTTYVPPPAFTFTGVAPTVAVQSTTPARPAPAPVQIAPEKLGTLDAYGAEAKCGGLPVAVGQTLVNNGVIFALSASGSNGSPELVINGRGTYTYAEIRVVTGDDPFVGHTSGVAVPAGEIHRAYDISTPGKTLKGVLVCL